jgi:hypothetical protein
MSAVFVHGVPDTPEVWDAVVSRFGRKDVVSVQPHGGAKLGGGRGAPLDREYVWHQAARAWQTPSLGEKVMAGCLHWSAV